MIHRLYCRLVRFFRGARCARCGDRADMQGLPCWACLDTAYVSSAYALARLQIEHEQAVRAREDVERTPKRLLVAS